MRQVSREIFAAYLEETLGYLPVIRAGLERFCADPSSRADMQQAYRLTHIIKGASSMVGLSELSHTAHFVEELLDELASNVRSLDEETLTLLLENFERIEAELTAHAAAHEQAEFDVPTSSFSPPLPSFDDILPVSIFDAPSSIDTIAEAGFSGEEVDLHLLEGINLYPLPDESPAYDLPPALSSLSTLEFDARFDNATPSDEQIDPDMLEVFQEEAEDHLRVITGALTRLEVSPEDYEALSEMRRSTHTLKGAAGVVGLRTLSKVAHHMEDALDRLFDGNLQPTPELISLLLRASDTLESLSRGANHARFQTQIADITSAFASLLETLPISSHKLLATTENDASNDASLPGADALLESSSESQSATEASALVWQDEERASQAFAEALFSGDDVVERPLHAASETHNGTPRARRVVRVPLDRLDSLVKLVGELVINRTELERHLLRLTREVGELQHSTDRLRRVSNKLESDYEVSSLRMNRAASSFTEVQAASVVEVMTMLGEAAPPASRFLANPLAGDTNRHGFDELEFDRYTEFHRLTRELSETTSDAASVQTELGDLLTEFDSALMRQRRLATEVQESLMRVRMISVGTLAARLQRTVRVAAEAESKAVDLQITGEQIELDTTVLDAMADPLLHILRNGVSHGIERASVRRAIGKPERGQIRLHAAYEGTQVSLTVSDDGGGIDARALRARAIESGFLTADEAARLTERETFALMFLPGLSTARAVSEVSGRGVGMDVVKDAIATLGGTLDIDSLPGTGTTLRIRLPLTLSATRAVIVRAGDASYALTLSVVEQITRVERMNVEEHAGEWQVRTNAGAYPLVHLGAWLGARGRYTENDKHLPVLLAKIGDVPIALVVDELVENRDIIIKSLGTHLRRVRGLMGATILGDGGVIPVINPHDLMHRAEAADASTYANRKKNAHALLEQELTVMIVDDSPSVRRVMTNFIQGAGWQPLVAKDGLDALELLHSPGASLPDLILLDVEMPRMDGYELLATLRQSAATNSIPVVMITSRTGEKHRRRAIDLGASEYLSKPYDGETLHTVIRRLTEKTSGQ